jgi:hypothetical protein
MDIDQKAERARAILEDLREPFQEIRERQMQAFANSAPDQPEAREQAHQMLMALNQLEIEIRQAIDNEAIQQRKVRKRAND